MLYREIKISVPFVNTVTFTGRLHCLADAVGYADLVGANIDIEVDGCLVYETDNDGGVVAYNTGTEMLWQAYCENKDQ